MFKIITLCNDIEFERLFDFFKQQFQAITILQWFQTESQSELSKKLAL